MKKRVLKPPQSQILPKTDSSERFVLFKNVKEIMMQNDQNLNNFKHRNISMSTESKFHKINIKYYIKSTKISGKFLRDCLEDNGILTNNIRRCLMRDVYGDPQKLNNINKRKYSDTESLLKLNLFCNSPYSPIKLLETVNGFQNHNIIGKNAPNININSSINVFEVFQGKLYMKLMQYPFTKRKIETNKNPPSSKQPTSLKVTSPLFNLKNSSSSTNKDSPTKNLTLYRSKFEELYGFTESELIANICDILPDKLYESNHHSEEPKSISHFSDNSKTLTSTSIGVDDIDLLPSKFERMESYLIEVIIFPGIFSILKDNNESSIYDLKTFTAQTKTRKNKIMSSLVDEVMKDVFDDFIINDHLQLTKKSPDSQGILLNEYFFANITTKEKNKEFERENIFDDSLSRDFIIHEDKEFILAIQYTEELIKTSNSVLERSYSGNMKRININPNPVIIEYFGNFGYVDGLELQNELSLQSTTSGSQFTNLEHHESFQALSHMCTLKTLMSRTSLFVKVDPQAQVSATQLEKSLKQMVVINNTGSSEKSLDSKHLTSIGSVDDNLVIAFTDRVLNNLSEDLSEDTTTNNDNFE